MKYKILRREVRSFLTLGELIADKHPELWRALDYHTGPRDITDIATTATWLTVEEQEYAWLMSERPKPGRAGDGDV